MYKFHGIVRWSFGWYTPNEVAFMVAELLLLLFAVSAEIIVWKKKTVWLPMAFALLSVPLAYGLCRTFSRGMILAVFGSFSVAGLLLVRLGRRPSSRSVGRPVLLLTLAMAAVLIVSLIVTNAYQRLSPDNSAGDASVLNRLAIWKSFLPMLAGAPWLGWGQGHSPAVFSNWFQDPASPITYISLVSSYLDIGMDHGLLGIWLLLVGGIGMLLFPLAVVGREHPSADANSADKIRGVYVIAMGALWLTANIFNSYVSRPWLFFGVAIPYGCLFFLEVRHNGWNTARRTAKWAVAGATVISLTLFVAAKYAAQKGDIVCSKVAATRVMLCHRSAPASGKRFRILFDQVALGISPGKALRKWFMEAPDAAAVETELYPFVTDRLDECTEPPDQVLAYGTACVAAARRNWPGGLTLLFPSTSPPRTGGHQSSVVLYLPATNELGLNESWVAWANQVGADVRIVPDSGLARCLSLNPFHL